MQKITPFLWFDTNAREAMDFYVSVFKNSKVISITRYGEGMPGPKGTVMTGKILLDGQEFVLLNGGPQFSFSQAISFVINCESQDEVDRYWENLSEGGEKQPCGWLKDKFGVSWQVVPVILQEMLNDTDPQKSQRVMMAVLQMGKIDIQKLKQAYNNAG
jgi:predicted 3-demethylubiquinone-9 3-methyltransferase (glyoxalase superfamily)